MMSTTFITTIEWQIFHNILSKYFITTFFDNIHYHNILRQTLKWQIINRCINEVSQQSISMLNYSTSLLQYLHLNYWVTDSSSDYETVMKQFFITKHLITKHLITKLYRNKLGDRYFTKLFTKLFITFFHRTFIHHNTFTATLFEYLHHKLQRIIFEKHLCYCSSNIFITNIHKLFITKFKW